MNDKRHPWRCSVCGREMEFLTTQSPMLTDKLWSWMLAQHGLAEERCFDGGPKKNSHFICYQCMEKTLGRKLTKEDLKPEVAHNSLFYIHYFHNIPIEVVDEVQKETIRLIKSTTPGVGLTQERFNREQDFINGIMVYLKATESYQAKKNDRQEG